MKVWIEEGWLATDSRSSTFDMIDAFNDMYLLVHDGTPMLLIKHRRLCPETGAANRVQHAY